MTSKYNLEVFWNTFGPSLRVVWTLLRINVHVLDQMDFLDLVLKESRIILQLHKTCWVDSKVSYISLKKLLEIQVTALVRSISFTELFWKISANLLDLALEYSGVASDVCEICPKTALGIAEKAYVLPYSRYSLNFLQWSSNRVPKNIWFDRKKSSGPGPKVL